MKKPSPIELLSPELSNKIAAGEVIERPSSVIKELVENSIDAGSSKITVRIINGGINLIEIIDNGHGIPKNQIRLAFQRHATSKIHSFDDLSRLDTMGFRGEALPSISSVSVVEAVSHYYEEDSAVFIRLEGGKEVVFEESSRDMGTTLSIKNLFYNTPARRKFLRKDTTEKRYIINEMNVQALAHPEISFKFISDDKEVFHYFETKDQKQRIFQIFGDKMESQLLPIRYESILGRIDGFAGTPEAARKSSMIYCFINQRYVKDKVTNKAVLEVYRSMLEKGRYPFVIVNIHMDPDKVDFNVHPTKREVRFEQSHSVYQMLHSAIKKALDQGFVKDEGIRDIMSIPQFDEKRPAFASPQSHQPRKTFSFQEALPIEMIEESPSKPQAPLLNKVIKRIEEDHQTTRENSSKTLLWQLHKTYIITSIKDGMVLIDQHAAAERIIYEKILKNYKTQTPCSQQLLFPEVIELTTKEFELLKETREQFAKMGFHIKEFSGTSAVIESVPVFIHNWESADTFKEILDDLLEEREVHTTALEKIARYTSCRTAIKAGDTLNGEQMQNLIDELFICEFPYTCPHGRPTLIKIKLTELEKRFGRK